MSEALDHDPAQFVPGSFGCHEAMHVTMILAETVDGRLCEHPAIKARADWFAKAEQARDLLHDLYQAIGAEHLSAPPP